MTKVVLKSLSVLLGAFFIFLGVLKVRNERKTL